MDNNNMYNQNQTNQNSYQNTTQGQQYSSFYEAPSQPQVQMPISDLEEPVSLGEWMITMLLMCIPCVNIVLMFVWAFGSSAKRSKSNYFKAALIWGGIFLVFYIVIIIIVQYVLISGEKQSIEKARPDQQSITDLAIFLCVRALRRRSTIIPVCSICRMHRRGE